MNSPLGSFLLPAGYEGPTGIRALARETSSLVEAARLIQRSRADRRARAVLPYVGSHRVPAHDPVLLVPGFMAGDPSLRAMSLFLRRQGFRTYRAQILVNAGCTLQAADRLESRIESIAIRRNRKVSIVSGTVSAACWRAVWQRVALT